MNKWCVLLSAGLTMSKIVTAEWGYAQTPPLKSGERVTTSATRSPQSLVVAYPPPEHETTASQIFLIGTAPTEGEVLVNGKPISRNSVGHFAPSFPLQIGENRFTVSYQDQETNITVTRLAIKPEIPAGMTFAPDTLTPKADLARLPGELICFGTVAPPSAEVTVEIGDRQIPLLPQTAVELPPNSAVLTANNQPRSNEGKHEGCTVFNEPGNLGKPLFRLNSSKKAVAELGKGEITILAPDNLEVVEITADGGIARTGPSTNYSRLTPLPPTTRAAVTGKEGEWLRLDYGGWIKAEETKLVNSQVLPRSLIRSITSRQTPETTEIIFPLQIPVPVSVRQEDSQIILTLYNTTAQTDTIRLDDDPLVKRLDWRQITPTQIEYTFQLKTQQQWGYDLRYEGTSLILALQHRPKLTIGSDTPLAGVKILLDPGHGGEELGAKGPTGYPEKEVNLVTSRLLKRELERLGATVYLTRDFDITVSLEERTKAIAQIKPDLALSIHYNALPDDGDAINTEGISMFWYHPQAHELAIFLQNYLVEQLNRQDYGVFWNNLALTRPHIAPSLLLELGFMINPDEFEWIIDPEAQEQLAQAIANGIVEWFASLPE